MNLAGIDLGTTSISGVLFDSDRDEVIWSGSAASEAGLRPTHSWENSQDPQKILARARELLALMRTGDRRADAVCITGQMHGILYVDRSGNAASPLYTWLDQRGSQLYDGKPTGGREATYAEVASTISGHRLSSGFGLTTHFYNLRNGLVPPEAAHICTIMDYVAMRLAGSTSPVTDPTNAAGMGAFLPVDSSFDSEALERLGIDGRVLPKVALGAALLENVAGGLLITGSVGDNQASFLGAVRDPEHSLLVNVGTSGQISIFQNEPGNFPGLDCRPFPEGYLLVGATLSGGKSLALLADFFRSVIEQFGGTPPRDMYERINELVLETEGFADGSADGSADGTLPEGPLVDTRFAGARDSDRPTGGKIERITLTNFTPARLAAGFMQGVADELHALYRRVPAEVRKDHPVLVGSGNSVRNNPAMRARLSRTFGSNQLLVPAHAEEAAFGAALLASFRSGGTRNIRDAMSHVSYL